MTKNNAKGKKEKNVFLNDKHGIDAPRQKRLRREYPYRTLAAAVGAVKDFLAQPEEYHVRLQIADGNYAVSEPIVFGAEDFGHPASTLTVSGIGQSRPVISSLREISGQDFRKVEGKPYYVYKMGEDERSSDGSFPDFRDFYADGERVALAESRIKGHIPFAIPNEKDRASEENLTYKLYIDADAVEDLSFDTLPQPELWIRVEWQIHCLHITGIDPSDKKDGFVAVRIDENEWRVFVRSYCQFLEKRPYVLRNSLCFLHKPRSFFYDRLNGKIYYYPENEYRMESTVFAYPRTENLLILDGVSRVALENLAFTGTGSNYVTQNGYITGQCGWVKLFPGATTTNGAFLPHAAVLGKNTTNCRIENCDFSELGTDALHFQYRTENLTVTGCSFRHIGATAIRIGRPVSKWDDESNASHGITVENNYIDGTGEIYNSNPGIYVSVAENMSISHNTILHSSYSAISVGWSWAVSNSQYGENKNLLNVDISYNYIDDFMSCMHDGGAIYTLGGNAWAAYTGYINTIRNNYIVIRDSAGEGMGGYHAIYHDQGSSHWHDADNVILARDDTPPVAAFVIGGEYRCLIENTVLLGYSLPDPPVMLERTDYDKESVIEKGTRRGLSPYQLPEDVREIIRSTGCSFAIAVPPVEKTYAHSVTIYVDPHNGNDRAGGQKPERPVATLGRASELIADILSTKTDVEITVLLSPGTYAVDKTIPIGGRGYASEDFHLTFRAAVSGSAVIENSARIAFALSDVHDISIEDLVFHSRNASLGSTVILADNVKRLNVTRSEFSRINGSAIRFTGICDDVSVTESSFAHIGGSALAFGQDGDDVAIRASRVSVTDCYFDSIGYIFDESPAIRFHRVARLTVKNNTFAHLSYEAVVLGEGNAPSRDVFGECKNVDRAAVSENYISDYALAGKGAAVRVTGGNCTRYHYQPFNIIANNVVVPGDACGGESGEYAVFSHDGCASQWHTRKNVVFISDKHPSRGHLCRFDSGEHAAYASWADENTVVGDPGKHVFCLPEEIEGGYDLHDKLTRFAKNDALSGQDVLTVLNAGCPGHRYTGDVSSQSDVS